MRARLADFRPGRKGVRPIATRAAGVLRWHMAAPSPAFRLTFRLELGAARIGPGKVALLEAVARTGSITASGRALRMSYRRAWKLLEEMNAALPSRVVATATGGPGGGGARLTPFGEAVVRHYRAIEREATAAAGPHVALIGDASAP